MKNSLNWVQILNYSAFTLLTENLSLFTLFNFLVKLVALTLIISSFILEVTRYIRRIFNFLEFDESFLVRGIFSSLHNFAQITIIVLLFSDTFSMSMQTSSELHTFEV